MIRLVEVEEFCCDKCGHVWRSQGIQLPKICAKCKSSKWNEHSGPGINPETVIAPAPPPDQRLSLDQLKALIAPIESKPFAPVVRESTWAFTRDPVQYADNGNCYRQQYDTANPKRRRTVQVDGVDHDLPLDT